MSPYNTSSPLGYVVNLDQHISLSQGNEKLIATSLSLVLLYLIFYWKTSKTTRVPAECTSNFLPRYFGAYRYLANVKEALDRGYKKYEGGTFKVPFLNRWIVVISKIELIEEVKKAPDDKLSITDTLIDFMAVPWTIGINIVTRHYHLEIVRHQLTRCLAARFADVKDEIIHSFKDLVPACDDKWVSVPALNLARNVVCRASNRVFVGLPLCRNPEYIDLIINFAISVNETGFRMSKFPNFMRPLVGPFITSTPKRIRKAMELLGPVIEERMRQYNENGLDWEGKPNDMLTWIMEAAPEEERRSPYELAKRMLWINFPAIHSSSNAFTQALLHLAAEPCYITPLRQEIENVVAQEGWTKVAMTKMWKLDSFLKESQRLHGVSMLPMNRKVMEDYTLSDGTFLPKGSVVSINAMSNHRNDRNYTNATSFDGFRFARKRENSTEDEAKHQMVATSSDYLAFGLGKHACPGRFFAVNELKAMVAYLVLNYDVKMENEGVRPNDLYKGARISPDPVAEVLFKRRKN